jgi:hypothetical protein
MEYDTMAHYDLPGTLLERLRKVEREFAVLVTEVQRIAQDVDFLNRRA